MARRFSPRRRRSARRRSSYKRVPRPRFKASMPNYQVVKLYLTQYLKQGTSSGNPKNCGLEFNINSPHMPFNQTIPAANSGFNIPTTYDQPKNWDMWVSQYNSYRCYGCKYVIDIYNDSADRKVIFDTYGPANTEVSESSDHIKLYNNTTVRNREVGAVDMQNGSRNKIRLKRYVPVYRALGITKHAANARDDLRSSTAGNPDDLVHYTVVEAIVGNTALNPSDCDWKIQMTFYVKFFDRKLQIPSSLAA